MDHVPDTPQDEVPVDVEPEQSTETGIDESVSVEDLLTELESVTAARDEYLRLAQSKQAELENFRKRVMKQQTEEVARVTGKLVDALLPVLDAFDYAAAHGEETLTPMRDQLVGALAKEGLVRLESDGTEFDPTVHEAVAHEPADGSDAHPVVSETMRAGYTWQGQLLRPAMVKVKG